MQGVTSKKNDKIPRAKRFEWKATQLLIKLSEERKRVLPKPQDCEKLVLNVYEDPRHFGVTRIYSLLQNQYWWLGMQAEVQRIVLCYNVCDRVHPSFNAPIAILQPLPIMGLGYRWSLQFAGPLSITKRHKKYVLAMIEHFLKWIELVALPDKFSEGVAYVFLDLVLS